MAQQRDSFGRRRMVTYVACATIIAVFGPFSAYAATSYFSISDPVHPTYKARVNGFGRLLTDASGSRVTVGGAVQTTPVGTPWFGSCDDINVGTGPCEISIPIGHTLDIRTVSVTVGRASCTPGSATAGFIGLEGAIGAPALTLPLSGVGATDPNGTTSNECIGALQVDLPITATTSEHVLNVGWGRTSEGIPLRESAEVFGYLS